MLNIQQHYNTSSIIISHDLSCVKLTSNKIILLINGKNYAEGTYEEFTKSDNKEIINFLGQESRDELENFLLETEEVDRIRNQKFPEIFKDWYQILSYEHTK
ncbi:MAG: hypothetical protein EBR08_01580 [Bacteroidia bacterium]|nr:hypothetical protein [Bacteroidia bacterium]